MKRCQHIFEPREDGLVRCIRCGTRKANKNAVWWGIAGGIAALSLIIGLTVASNNTRDSRDTQRSRTTTSTTLLSYWEADALLDDAIERAVRCDWQAQLSTTECSRRAVNAVCEDRFGGVGWATSEEYACREAVRAASRRR